MTSHNHAALLATNLGIPLFTTDRYLPGYTESQVGRWRLTRSGFTLDRGYRTGLWATCAMPVLLRDSDGLGQSWETWMSLSPKEIESQELGCLYASGHTVVMGLGMGWVAINMALNPAVKRVSVIERDPEVIDLFGQSRALDGLASSIAKKIRIIQADALEWRPDETVDFLYADIWRCLDEPQTLDDVRRMQANVQAAAIYFWGQELVIHALAEKGVAAWSADPEWKEVLRHTVSEIINLPLLIPDDFDYGGMIKTVVRQQQERLKTP